MKSTVEHVKYQLPNGSTRVRYLLEIIMCDNTALMAKKIQHPMWSGSQQEAIRLWKAVAFILPACPMALCLARGEFIVTQKNAGISAMTLNEGIGCTGVKLWWYPRKEFAASSQEQKNELREFTNSNAERKKKDTSARKIKEEVLLLRNKRRPPTPLILISYQNDMLAKLRPLLTN